ncbi:MAG: metal-dependent transcriptional regulator [Hydrotalea sp. AMD]|uniref:metal-dependent transcriptional regulator n=1 Tax=Hydrotalea sp. AMD TaxID=2501297 RepID=UPI0009441AD0|nr:metal-dependent transcriptional regulator [Hydrotalea sp. AMD]RTL47305.1 MAG: metal-dependent transcriptional regulator [Sphingobacteriales bacterium]RWZ85722.1 MAG: metal-dependent transcriptional regulator [Hydrotalea sp. AMD]
MLSQTEENYLKALFHITSESSDKSEAGTNELAAMLNVKPATANDMLKKLKEKKLINYEKYGKISLTASGKKQAIEIVRKHRLWETFLYEKFEFTWDEVHEVAEQLEHIHSPKLIEKLDKFLDYPEFDPHGDAIPNAKGELKFQVRKNLSQVAVGKTCKLIAVKDNTASFLQYVVKVGLGLSSKIKVVSRQEFDGTMEIEVNGKKSSVSQKFAENLYVI